MSDAHVGLLMNVEWHPELKQYVARVQVTRTQPRDHGVAPMEIEIFTLYLPDGTMDPELPGLSIVGDTAGAVLRKVLDHDLS